ncbi:heme ABC transporter ATP-binding protein [Corynebacterium sp. 13CS0277]|uniref:heme ABC transporter ATP-binding protein n=1 Tax=Corynebacterium sp. 13CS0277 TaxID=2071994 RepID=UPI000D025B60|nr:heme ABC transporter ATP-binding protein [Corynebacterium sp. 13CS0277]PRQ11366.1 heme ABC transporter ATP-binding protein [Corynebacterium sp. 13CS0277]
MVDHNSHAPAHPAPAGQSAADATDVVVVDHLAVRAGERLLLQDVSFTARRGRVVGLIGPNGAGKSTLLAALAGDNPPAAGQVRLAGVDPYATSPKQLARTRAVMLQDVGVSFAFLVRDVVDMGRRPWAGDERAAHDDQVVAAAMHATEVAHLADRDVMTLSGGERARVALARVLAQQTPVVFLDEPTAALDIGHQEQALGLMRAMARAGATVVVVLHDLTAAASYCDDIVCLGQGGIVAQGPVAEVYTSETLSTVYGWPIEVATTTDADGTTRVHVLPARGHVSREHTAGLHAGFAPAGQ